MLSEPQHFEDGIKVVGLVMSGQLWELPEVVLSSPGSGIWLLTPQVTIPFPSTWPSFLWEL